MGFRCVLLLLAALAGSARASDDRDGFTVRVWTPDGSPAAHGSVELHHVELGGERGRSQGFAWHPVEHAPPPIATVALDESGLARLPDPMAGVWRLVVRSPGHAPAVREVRWIAVKYLTDGTDAGFAQMPAERAQK